MESRALQDQTIQAPQITATELSRCRHFGLCGGCSRQDLSYPDQLAAKTARFQTLIQPLGFQGPASVEPAQNPWFYRNKVELSFTRDTDIGGCSLGFKEKGKWYRSFNLKECRIFDPQLGPVVERVCAWANKHHLAPYDSRHHKGFLRYLVVRKGFVLSNPEPQTSGPGYVPHWLVTLVTAQGQSIPARELIGNLDELGFSYSLFWGIQDRLGDTAEVQSWAALKGEPYLWQPIFGQSFRYGLASFFQTNPAMFEKLLHDLKEQISGESWPAIFDLYCGVGAIAMSLSQEARVSIRAVEISSSSINDARFNKEKLNMKNVEFLEAKTESVIKGLTQEASWPDSCVILDPPRSGLHPKVLEALLAEAPKKIVYVSCNPSLCVRLEMPRLSENYKMTFIKAYDFFPQTEHDEALFVLERRK